MKTENIKISIAHTHTSQSCMTWLLVKLCNLIKKMLAPVALPNGIAKIIICVYIVTQ